MKKEKGRTTRRGDDWEREFDEKQSENDLKLAPSRRRKESGVKPAMDSDRRRARPDWLLSARPLSLVACTPSVVAVGVVVPFTAADATSTRWYVAQAHEHWHKVIQKRGKAARGTRPIGLFLSIAWQFGSLCNPPLPVVLDPLAFPWNQKASRARTKYESNFLSARVISGLSFTLLASLGWRRDIWGHLSSLEEASGIRYNALMI